MSIRDKFAGLSVLNLRIGLFVTAGFFSFAVNLGNFGAYIFQVLLSHALSKSDYGLFNFLFTTVLLVLTPAPAIASIIIHLNSSQQTRRPWTVDSIIMLFVVLSGVLTCAFLVVLFALPMFSIALCFGGSLLFLISLLHMLAMGVRQTSQAHARVALAQMAIGLVRAGMAGILVGVGAHINVLDAMMICVLASLVACLALVPIRYPSAYFDYLRESYQSLKSHFLDVCKTVAPLIFGYTRLMLAFALLQNADLLIVTLRWPGDLAGDYAGASVLARIGFLIPSSLFTMTFAETVLTRCASSVGKKALADASFFMIVLASVGATLFFLCFSEPLLIYLFNSDYASASVVTRQLGAAMALLALLQALIFRLYAQDEALSLAPLAYLSLGFIFIAGYFVTSPKDVASGLLTIVVLLMMIYGKKLIGASVNKRT